MVITYSKGKHQPGTFANPARDQLKKKINISLSAFAPENLVSRDGFRSPVTRQFAHLPTQADMVLTYGTPPEFRGGVHLFILNHHTSPSGQSQVYRI